MSTWKILSGTACAYVLLTACVQYPTERQEVAEMRPQISFRFDTTDPATLAARVIVDDRDAGTLGDFRHGVGALRVTPGTRTVRVVRGPDVLLDERAYIGDGVSRSFNIR